MTSIIISSKNKKDLDVLLRIADGFGAKGRTLPPKLSEDILFGSLMDKVKTGRKVTKAAVMKKLLNDR